MLTTAAEISLKVAPRTQPGIAPEPKTSRRRIGRRRCRDRGGDNRSVSKPPAKLGLRLSDKGTRVPFTSPWFPEISPPQSGRPRETVEAGTTTTAAMQQSRPGTSRREVKFSKYNATQFRFLP